MNPELICMHCMSQLEEPKGICPVCGFDNASAENAPNQLDCGSILAGTYLVGCVLGQGGFGITYIGLDLNLNLKVAIKEYYPEGCVTRDGRTHTSVVPLPGEKKAFFEKGREKFVSEAQILARFTDEPSIVGVRGFFHENGTAYIVMNFVEGETLKARAARFGGRLPAAEVLGYIKPLCASLARVHEAGLLHRDISPDNIIIKKNGMPVLLDFGAARQISMTGEHSNTINVKHGFAPEEQYRTHGEQGPWTDVYALAATIYRLTTGENPPQALDRLTSDTPITPPNRLGADLTPAQEAAVLHGLAVRASDRISSMDQLLRELSLATVKPPVKQVEKPKPASFDHYEKTQQTSQRPGRPKFLLPVLISGGVVALALILILALNIFGKPKTEEAAISTQEPTATPLPLPPVGQVLEGHLAAGSHYSAVLNFDGTVTVYGGKKSAINANSWTNVVEISGYGDLLVGLCADGTVLTTGSDTQYLEDKPSSWFGISWLEAGYQGVIALTNDGYIQYAGTEYEELNQCQKWKNIGKLVRGDEHIVGITYDGTMVAVGKQNVNQTDVEDLTDVLDAATSCQTTYVLKKDGTVMIVGGNPEYEEGQANAATWANIIDISSGNRHVVGLHRDGTVIADGAPDDGKCNTDGWKNIIAICAGYNHTIAIDSEGVLHMKGSNEDDQITGDGMKMH